MLFVESCIVADPPEYRAAVQTRPVLNTYSAVPLTTQVLTVYQAPTPSKVPTLFTVQVRSEDAGEPLRAVFFLDYQIKPSSDPHQDGERFLISRTIAASTYDNLGRTATYGWSPMTTSGCHFITLIVAHESTFLQNDLVHLDQRYADDDAAILTWTVNVDPSADMSLKNCPTKTDSPAP